jgi:acetolactate synthase regulatory subunit
MTPKEQPIETRTIAVLVDNEPGVLARVIGLFSGRGYNIESLTVSEVDPEARLSRITVITSGTAQPRPLRLRDDRQERQIGRLHRSDAAAWAGRRKPHRRGRDLARLQGTLAGAPAANRRRRIESRKKQHTGSTARCVSTTTVTQM